MLSKAQKKLINELCTGRVIVEDCCDGKLSYSTAKVMSIPHGYYRPRRANKQTVWALISFGLIEINTIWNDGPYPPREVYVLSSKGHEIHADEIESRIGASTPRRRPGGFGENNQ